MISQLVNLVVYLIILGIVLGLLLYLVNISPVPEPYKGWLRFLVLAVAVLIVIYVLIGLAGDGVPSLRMRGALEFPVFGALPFASWA